jgi:hypothetical protein
VDPKIVDKPRKLAAACQKCLHKVGKCQAMFKTKKDGGNFFGGTHITNKGLAQCLLKKLKAEPDENCFTSDQTCLRLKEIAGRGVPVELIYLEEIRRKQALINFL